MRIVHLIKGLGRGGAENLLVGYARQRSEAYDHSVGFFLPLKDALVEDLRQTGVPVKCFSSNWSLMMLLQVPAVAAWLTREHADVVHAHLPLACVVARLAGRISGVPVVYTEHNLQERYHPLTRWANRFTWHCQDSVVAVSNMVAESSNRHCGQRIRTRVIHNGIDVEKIQTSAEEASRCRNELGIPQEAPVMGTVAVLRQQKRLDVWLQAAREISEIESDTRFLIVGDGPLRRDLEELANGLEIRDKVIFAGLREDVRPFLAAMDVYVMSSEFEGLPLALLEAMAAARPVVATSVGGVPEVVESERTGLLVPPGDPRKLAEKTVGLFCNRSQRVALGLAGRERVESYFNIHRMAHEIESLYHEITGRGHRAA